MQIDINCDLGEGVGNDEELMPLISSCNIACGGHIGNEKSMYNTLLLAKKYNVKIGAHPSFPDKDNFGRKIIDINSTDLRESIYNQILNLKTEADNLQITISHIKAHGALYNVACTNIEIAKAFISAVKKTELEVSVFAPYNSAIASQAKKGNIPVKYEVFLDRTYTKNGNLVNRNQSNALIYNSNEVFKQLYGMFTQQKIITISGESIYTEADTFCLHGDNKNAVSILKHLHKKCKEKNISIN